MRKFSCACPAFTSPYPCLITKLMHVTSSSVHATPIRTVSTKAVSSSITVFNATNWTSVHMRSGVVLSGTRHVRHPTRIELTTEAERHRRLYKTCHPTRVELPMKTALLTLHGHRLKKNKCYIRSMAKPKSKAPAWYNIVLLIVFLIVMFVLGMFWIGPW